MASLDLRLFEEIENALGERLEQLASELVSGKPIDWADYRMRVGKISGLREALQIANEAQKSVLGVDDNRER